MSERRRLLVRVGDANAHGLCGAVARGIDGGDADAVGVAAVGAGRGLEVRGGFEAQLAALGVQLKQGVVGATGQGVAGHREVVGGLCGVHDAALLLGPVERDLALGEYRRLFVCN